MDFCRWLFIPKACNLGIECDLETPDNGDDEGRSASGLSGFNCMNGDYLRVLGYRGTSDEFFCGKRTLNVTFSGNDAVALVFRSGKQQHQQQHQRGIIEDLLKGFNCKVVCKEPTEDVTTTTTTTSTTTTTTTNKCPCKKTESGTLVCPESCATTTTTKKPGISPRKCRCGMTRQARIVCPPGYNCTAGKESIPWQAAIVNRGKAQPWCGGALISDRYILSAAHCFRGKSEAKVEVILGEHDWTTKADRVHDQRFKVEKIIRHPDFDRLTAYDHDFALLKLAEPVQGRLLRPVCLPEAYTWDDLIGAVADVSGWGIVDPDDPRRQSKKLQRVQVTVMSHQHCRSLYPANPVTESMMCAAVKDGDACFGDSGGPLTIRSRGGRGPAILEGVISWGKNCAKAQWPGVYSRVRRVIHWIKDNTRDSNYCL